MVANQPDYSDRRGDDPFPVAQPKMPQASKKVAAGCLIVPFTNTRELELSRGIGSPSKKRRMRRRNRSAIIAMSH